MPELLPFEEALKAIEDGASQLVASEAIPLMDSLNRIAAQDICAQQAVPAFDNSAMDGYAFRIEDWQSDKRFPVSQRIPAGYAPERLTPNTCARIFTGANIPTGANIVVMQEEADVSKQSVRFPFSKSNSPKQGDNIRPKGQDIQLGQTVLAKGTKITPMHIGLLSSLGLTELKVFKPLRVGILTTGDELVPAGHPLQKGQIYNSNGPMLMALVRHSGYVVANCLHAEDTSEATEKAITELLQCSDVILSSGGVSVGEEDHVKSILQKLGSVHLWKIAIKPGKPLVHATLSGIPFLGLPGNPSSTLVTYHWFARRLLAKSAGQSLTCDRPYPVIAGFSREKTIKRDEFIRVAIGDDGLAYAHPQQSSGALLAACESQGYLHIKAHSNVEYGNHYDFYPFTGF
ncbi:Molybdopterin molybdenumtransferase [Marinomonas spartinae]|uniref:molybdopterin molybdotransferase MoeA n=1 Tax=Marinomonas spartinae TaxID=1792290 RepID=UPI000808B79A|nr:molybdopterin molybdotransferase MoeA [Marinomonas spartinae]SBS32698.1 Molybdopterin molybdenumtransferase [Marinomonas spartinae]